MNRSSFLGLLLALLVVSGASIDAATVYDNGAPLLSETGGFELTHWIEADSFTLSDGALVNNVKFWDLEIVGYFQSSILWEIHSESGSNTPGALLFSGTSTNLTHVATGRSDLFSPVFKEYVSTFDITPVSLPAGTYWLVLHNGPLTNNLIQNANVFWETADNPSTMPSRTIIAPFTGPWDSNSSPSKVAFQLSGVPGPHMTAFVFNNGVPRISFTTVAGQNYRVEYKNNLLDASWTPLPNAGNVSGTGNVVQISDPDPNIGNVPHRFYRVVLLTASPASAEPSPGPASGPPAQLQTPDNYRLLTGTPYPSHGGPLNSLSVRRALAKKPR